MSARARDVLVAEQYDLETLMISSKADFFELGIKDDDATKLVQWIYS